MKLEINGVSLVLRGAFNPKIFQPAWFKHEGLLPESEAESVQDLMVHPDLTIFRLPWPQFQVGQDQLIASTAQFQQFRPLRDLIQGTFELLNHTPITQLGINLDQHFRAPNEVAWNEFGHRLAPKDVWKKSGFKDPGLVQMTVVEKDNSGRPCATRIQIEASSRINPGIFFNVNQHFECAPGGAGPNAAAAVEILKSQFDNCVSRSEELIKGIISQNV